MKPNSDRVNAVLAFLGRSSRGKLRDVFLDHFGYHLNTYYNKMNPNFKGSYFSTEEMLFIERYGREKGMTDDHFNHKATTAA